MTQPATALPMSNVKSLAAAKLLLAATFPLAFPQDNSQLRPLALSTREDIDAWITTSEPCVKRCAILRAVLHHCSRTSYRRTLVAGAMRINLQGEDVSPVTEEVAAFAQNQVIQSRNQRIALIRKKRDAEKLVALKRVSALAAKIGAANKLKEDSLTAKKALRAKKKYKPPNRAVVIVKKRRFNPSF